MNLTKSEISLLRVLTRNVARCEDERTKSACRSLHDRGLLVQAFGEFTATDQRSAVVWFYYTSSAGRAALRTADAGGAA